MNSGKSIGNVVIVGNNVRYTHKPGVAIPAEVMYEYLLAITPSVKLIRISNDKEYYHNEEVLESSHVVILNGLGVMLTEVAEKMLKKIAGKHLFLYMHETEFVLDDATQKAPHRMVNFWRSLPYLWILCSTKKQQQFYSSLGLFKTSVVYNTFQIDKRYTWKRLLSNNKKKRVLMVGTIQSRKGPRLFDEVAIESNKLGLNFSFTWVGPRVLSKKDGDYKFSHHVEWIEQIQRNEIYDLYSKSDIFLLTSIDDPLPLSATEAAAAGLIVLSFKNTGTSEVVNEVYGDEFQFERYDKGDVVNLLKKIEDGKRSEIDYSKISSKFISKYFVRKVYSEIENNLSLTYTFPDINCVLDRFSSKKCNIGYLLKALHPSDLFDIVVNNRVCLDKADVTEFATRNNNVAKNEYSFIDQNMINFMLLSRKYKDAIIYSVKNMDSKANIFTTASQIQCAIDLLMLSDGRGLDDILSSIIHPLYNNEKNKSKGFYKVYALFGLVFYFNDSLPFSKALFDKALSLNNENEEDGRICKFFYNKLIKNGLIYCNEEDHSFRW